MPGPIQQCMDNGSNSTSSHSTERKTAVVSHTDNHLEGLHKISDSTARMLHGRTLMLLVQLQMRHEVYATRKPNNCYRPGVQSLFLINSLQRHIHTSSYIKNTNWSNLNYNSLPTWILKLVYKNGIQFVFSFLKNAHHSQTCNRLAMMTQFSLEMSVDYNTTILKHLCKICRLRRLHWPAFSWLILHRVANLLSSVISYRSVTGRWVALGKEPEHIPSWAGV